MDYYINKSSNEIKNIKVVEQVLDFKVTNKKVFLLLISKNYY